MQGGVFLRLSLVYHSIAILLTLSFFFGGGSTDTLMDDAAFLIPEHKIKHSIINPKSDLPPPEPRTACPTRQRGTRKAGKRQLVTRPIRLSVSPPFLLLVLRF